jgi:hypothetical protein
MKKGCVNFFRWVFVIPAGIAGAFIAHVFSTFCQFYAHGAKYTLHFMAGSDMNGDWIDGTVMILWIRGSAGALSTFIVYYVAPSHKRIVASLWVTIWGILWIGLIIFGAVVGLRGSFSYWYKNSVECLAFILGSGLVLWEVFRNER